MVVHGKGQSKERKAGHLKQTSYWTWIFIDELWGSQNEIEEKLSQYECEVETFKTFFILNPNIYRNLIPRIFFVLKK